VAGDTVESWFDELKKHVEMCPTTSPTTGSPTTSATTVSPTTVSPTPVSPTTSPTTGSPTTVSPTTVSPTTEGCALSEVKFYDQLQEFLDGPGGRFTKDIKFQKDSNDIILSSR
jgi:hypothetical protein